MIATYDGKLTAMRDNGGSADLVVHVDDDKLAAVVKSKMVKDVTIRLEDGRRISEGQRKKIYATLRDISLYTGYLPEEAKEVMKYVYIERTGGSYFSLSDCSMDTARAYLNVLTDFCLENGVMTADMLSERTDDIDTYLYQCLRHRRCAICGRDGEMHHWDAVGMGNDRRTYDDSGSRKICLCRTHHTIAHQQGVKDFEKNYHVYGILYKEDEDGQA